jgi:hypothetical protein
MEYTASSVYGTQDSLQPNNSTAPTHAGQPEPFAITLPTSGGLTARNPVIVLLALLLLAIGLLNFSVGVNLKGGK